MNTKILASMLLIGAAAMAIGGGITGAFFSDTETSTGNTFAAGAIDLKVDFDGYFNKVADGTPNAGTWNEKDLVAGTDKFFNFIDLKPGDFGEGTISLHVYDNDAWGIMVIEDVIDGGNTCVDPETEVVADADCYEKAVGTAEADGELRENLIFSACLDEGAIPGFQNQVGQIVVDQTEGDNICQTNEPVVITPGTIDLAGETHKFWGALAAYRASIESQCTESDPDGDGHADYKICQGIARDGRLVGSTVYQLAVMWNLPYATGNEAQSDTLQATIKFEAVQHRNNPDRVF